jgi:hypothetical protein
MTLSNHTPETIGLLDKRIGKHMDVFRLMLTLAGEKTVLPEILEVFGNDMTVKFLDIFAGVTIKVPSRDIITDAARDTDIYLTCKKAADPKEVYELLADRYEVEAWWIKKHFAELDKALSKHYKLVIK